MDKTNINALVQTITRSLNSINKRRFSMEQSLFLPEISIASAIHMICTCMYNPLDRLRNLCQVQNGIKGSENFFLFISLRERFLTTGTSTSKMPRRNRIPLEHRKRIVRAFEDEQEDYLLVSDTLGVNRSTARGIVARYIREGRIQERPRGGRNNVQTVCSHLLK